MTDTGGGSAWRIDELARRAGIPVGTVRLYLRDGLVPPGHRVGRAMTYGASHLDRLVRIQRLKAANFTLTAIKRMLDDGVFVKLDRLFGSDGRPRSQHQLVDETGVDATLVRSLESMGFLAPPADRGAAEYDGGEVTVLQAITELIGMGTPPAILEVVLPIYVRHVRALEADLLVALSGRGDLGPDVARSDVSEYARRTAADSGAFLYRWDVVVDYLHHRMIQRLVHRARRAASTATAPDRAAGPTAPDRAAGPAEPVRA